METTSKDFVINDDVLKVWKGNVVSVRIPDDVRVIGSRAFLFK